MRQSFEGELHKPAEEQNIASPEELLVDIVEKSHKEDYPKDMIESIGKKPLNLHKYYENKVTESRETIERIRNSSIPNKDAIIKIEQEDLEVYEQMVEKFKVDGRN